MAVPRLEQGVGPIDNVNTTFFTPTAPFTAGSVRYYLNGQLLKKECVTEVNPTTGELEVEGSPAPRTGDIVQFFYMDESGVQPDPFEGTRVCIVFGELEPLEDLQGFIEDIPLYGVLEPDAAIVGDVTDFHEFSGGIDSLTDISGSLRVCS